MMSFFESIWSILESIVEFFKSAVQGLITLFQLIPSVLSTATTAIGYLPSLVTIFATLTITISIIYIIVGRETGSGG